MLGFLGLSVLRVGLGFAFEVRGFRLWESWG